MHLLLIANPTAGSHAPQRIEQARRALQQHGATVELYLTGAAGDAEKQAAAMRSGPFERIVVAGGDGTLNEAVNGLAGSAMPLAFIPMGTTNVFALEAGIPFDIDQAAAIACGAPPRPVTLGTAGERYFLLMAGVGFDGQVVASVSSRLKRLLGKGAYVIAALQQFLVAPPRHFEVSLGGQPSQASGLLLANARCYGGSFTLTPAADILRPDLEVCTLRRPGRLALIRQSLSLVRHRPLPASVGELLTLSEARVDTPGIPVQIDGDFLGVTPMSFGCAVNALQLVYPA